MRRTYWSTGGEGGGGEGGGWGRGGGRWGGGGGGGGGGWGVGGEGGTGGGGGGGGEGYWEKINTEETALLRNASHRGRKGKHDFFLIMTAEDEGGSADQGGLNEKILSKAS